MAQTLLYVDPWSGVSGDMLLAALLDTDRGGGTLDEELRRVASGLGLPVGTVEITRDVEWGVTCTRVRIVAEEAAPLRRLADLDATIGGASLPSEVRARALEAVHLLAEVEAAVHGCAVEEIQFHEIGAVDTLVDIVGVFALTAALGVEKVVVGTIPVGGGTVEIMHGCMGVPAPATALLLQGYEVVGGPEMRELTTPTGALLVRQLGAEGGTLPRMRSERVGYGAGSQKLQRGPNLLRVVLGSEIEEETAGSGEGEWAEPAGDLAVELQTNVDDASPEVIGYTMESLRAAGALDAWVVPAQMKKDRPGVVIHVLVAVGDELGATEILFRQTGTLGVRRRLVSRHVASRGHVSVDVAGRSVRVKWGRWQGSLVSLAAEYEDAVAASKAGLPLKDVMQLALEAAREVLEP